MTPANKDEALDKIRIALETYLHLSASPISSLTNLNDEIAIQRLAGEIQALQSRLSLARAEIQLKEATIQTQQLTVEKLRQMGAEVMIDGLRNITPKPPDDDREEVLGGLAELTKLKGKGFNINLPEIFRRLKQWLREEE